MTAPRSIRMQIGVAAALLLLVAAVALAPLWAVVHAQWTGVTTYRHGYLLLVLAGWLAWRALRNEPRVGIRAGWRYLPLLVAVLAALGVLELLYLNVPRVFLLPPLVVTCAGLVFGGAVAKRLLGPAVLMYGALPVWEAINGFLQALTTAVVSAALASTQVPAFIEGNLVRLPAGTFEITEDCSGLRYVVVGVTLGLFYALAFLPSWRRRGMLLAAVVASVVVCNWVRVYVVILAGHLTDMQHYLVTVDHRAFGWGLFGAFLLPALWLARRLQAPAAEARPAESASAPVGHGRGVIVAATVAALLLALPRIGAMATSGTESAEAAPLLAASAEPPGATSAWQPVFVNALEERAALTGSAEPLEVYRALYPRQDAAHRLIAYRNRFVPESWQALGQRRATVELHGRPLRVVELEGYLDQRRRIVWAWYWVAGEPAAGPLEAKLLELKGLLAGRRDAAAVAVSTECGVDCGAARERLAAFLEHSPALRGFN